ncbi:N-acetylneuraminate synthase [Pseudodesulfovibrio sp. JC047]|uniref:N-acetylneuraminate synthase family protein n=1 Tax=Pseudodesulfovibrio sp. JC047 TaxID=2683199 RepID=UPI0013D2C66B|nr:N-acetylneuraminate synthase family protein [Pseudodesulfovibrio sp. JC047]NDV20643.1 N-acetylneuraminate synthase [Pseudodesulfovibrio sp. JC047]
MHTISIQDRRIGADTPTYFIADIAANHDGDLDRAVELIRLAAEAGADAAKFQHFTADKIVSQKGFDRLGGKASHQAAWSKSVSEVYADASVPRTWTATLHQACIDNNIHFFSTPYDFEAVDLLDEFVPAYKIGSGDIDWAEMLEYIATKNKPVLLATGAASLHEVCRSVDHILQTNSQLVLMQCNTNYTGSTDNFAHINLNVLKSYATLYPDLILGLSDHTPGLTTVLGAIALGARVVEKHFTDDETRTGPDHGFSMTPTTWRDMVDRARELEQAMGSPLKQVEANEAETVCLQRRCLRAARPIAQGERITKAMLSALRPAPAGSISPWDTDQVVGSFAHRAFEQGEELRWDALVAR